MITQQGALNTTALVVPDLYVQLVPPAHLLLNGVPSNLIGVVGSASWGPVNKPLIIGNMAEYAASFGPVMNRPFDMGTHVAIATQQGASAFRCLRVTDGTESAATAEGPAGCIHFTAIHSGSLGNRLSVTLSAGSKAGSWAAIIGLPGLPVERFDNVEGNGASFWTALALAINTGAGQLSARGSRFVRATTEGGATAPSTTTFQLSGGSDGAAGVSTASLLGDMTSRSGMYALTGQGCALLDLCDATERVHWPEIEAFAASEGLYAMLAGGAGETIPDAVAAKSAAGLDSSAVKLLFGDWLSWWDATNAAQRLVSPQAFAAGRLSNLSPEQSGLNKPIYAIAGSEGVGLPGTGRSRAYSSAELQALFEAGIDLITNPGAGGQTFWTLRLGHNCASNPAIYGDSYTRLTNYIVATLAAGMGLYVGRVINAALLREIRSTLLAFLSALLDQGLLGSTDGSRPFAVLCDAANNPPTRLALGYVQADVQIRYQGITEKFLVNLDGGASVLVSSAGSAASGGSAGGSGGSGSTGTGSGGSSSSTTLSFQTPPIGPYAAGQTDIGINAVLSPGSTTASITFGWSTSATTAPTTWTPGLFVNSQSNGDALFGAYLAAPSAPGTYYGWVSTADGSVHAVSGAVVVS
ncbi:phage tail protein [Acidisoma sp. 7E03]